MIRFSDFIHKDHASHVVPGMTFVPYGLKSDSSLILAKFGSFPSQICAGEKTQNVKQKDINMKAQSSTMKKTILKILEKRNQLDKFLNSKEFHLRIENGSYMPLVIERHGQHVTVTHYYSQNGDQIADPDLEMLIGADGEWYPVGLQLCTGHYSRARWVEDGKEFINLRINQEIKSFSTMWARNLVVQGW